MGGEGPFDYCPKCKSDNIVSYEPGDVCPTCDGHKVIWFMLKGEPEKDVCDACSGEGVIKERYYRCNKCHNEFMDPICEENLEDNNGNAPIPSEETNLLDFGDQEG